MIELILEVRISFMYRKYGKQETRLKPQRITLHLWKLAYDRINPRGMHFVYVS
jgi:hypothetical protein